MRNSNQNYLFQLFLVLISFFKKKHLTHILKNKCLKQKIFVMIGSRRVDIQINSLLFVTYHLIFLQKDNSVTNTGTNTTAQYLQICTILRWFLVIFQTGVNLSYSFHSSSGVICYKVLVIFFSFQKRAQRRYEQTSRFYIHMCLNFINYTFSIYYA